MLTLSRQFQAHVGAYKEYKRLIEREKLMIDPTSIVLVDDFMMYAVAPQQRRNTYFGNFFNMHAARIEGIAKGWAAQGQIPSFPLSYDQLTPAMQRIMDKRYPAPKPVDMEKKVGEIIQQMRQGEGPGFYVFHAQPSAKEMRYRAVYLGHIIHAANVCTERGNALAKREFWAQLRGEGHQVLSFWRDVRGLKDYSGFFPDKPKPDGNDRRKRQQEGRAPVWSPVFQ